MKEETVMSVNEDEFRLSLEKENEIPHDHPKAELLFEKAWEFGHAVGIEEVRFFL
jgi:hypothetical protein